jgi:hypothetical protein
MMQVLSRSGLEIVSNHPVLNQVAADIFAGLEDDLLPAQRVTVFVGIHRRYRLALLRRGYRIGINTEHYFDADGNRLWRRERRLKILLHFLRFHRILDLSAANAPHYQWLPGFLRRRVVFGPYIFSGRDLPFSGFGGPLVFFGSINGRRHKLLASLDKERVQVLSASTFGAELTRQIDASAAVLNIHFLDGSYTEYPRLLSAYNRGKILVSEPLGPDMIAGRHYAVIGQSCDAHHAQEIFQNFSQEVAKKYGFSAFLKRMLQY